MPTLLAEQNRKQYLLCLGFNSTWILNKPIHPSQLYAQIVPGIEPPMSCFYESFDWILNPRHASTIKRVPSRHFYALGYNDTCVRDDALSCTVECIVYGLYDSGSL